MVTIFKMAPTTSIKRKAPSVDEKLAIVKKWDEEHKTKSQKDIAEELGIAGSTLRTILQNRAKLTDVVSGCSRQKLKVGKFEDLETILLEWFHEARGANLPISGPIVCEKAQEIAGRLGVDDFKASTGWLDRFKKRHGIVYRQISGEAEAVSDTDVAAWTEKTLPMLLSGYELENVYNADEFGLFYKLMPDKSLVLKKESCHGGKLSKERVTVLACSNATGTHKLKLLVIGKSQKPCCFKNVKTLPVDYAAQPRAWMTSELFIKWLKGLDNFFEKKNKHILLFVDNCPSHPKDIPLRHVKVVYFPPNATSKLQPLDQGVIKVLKQKYRKKLVQRYLREMESTVQHNTKSTLNILDSIHYISAAWNDMEPTTITNCFRKAKFWSDAEQLVEKEEDTEFLEEYADYIGVDDDLVTAEVRSLEQLVDDHTQDPEEETNSDEEDTPAAVPSVGEALQSLNNVRSFISSVEESEEMLSLVHRLKNFMYQKTSKNAQQSKLDAFFRPQ